MSEKISVGSNPTLSAKYYYKEGSMKVLILGSGGIVGQHMKINEPEDVEAVYSRKTSSPGWYGIDVDHQDVRKDLDIINPDVIINLAGENRVDVVESDPQKYVSVNVDLVKTLCTWVTKNNKYLIQGSTQGIFSGDNSCYNTTDIAHPLTHYGKQKLTAEHIVLAHQNTEICRLTFVIGVRPFQDIGRKNPLESMIEDEVQLQVDDRFFSPLFAQDAAKILWNRALGFKNAKEKIVHLGIPIKCSRFAIARDLKYNVHGCINPVIKGVSHEHFKGIAPRPKDTTWCKSLYIDSYEEGLMSSYLLWEKVKK